MLCLNFNAAASKIKCCRTFIPKIKKCSSLFKFLFLSIGITIFISNSANAQLSTPSTPGIGTITQPTCENPTGSIQVTGLPATERWKLTLLPNNTTVIGTGTEYTFTGLTPGNYSFKVTNETGTGLAGKYYSNKSSNYKNLSGTPDLTRTDATINFSHNSSGKPADEVNNDYFAIRWTGKIKPKYSETYTFYTTRDDGLRLYVNNQNLVDQWNDHAAIVNSGIIALQAGKKYDITVEFYERTGEAVAKLEWQSTSQSREVVPAISLFPDDTFVDGNTSGTSSEVTLNSPTDVPTDLLTISANPAGAVCSGTSVTYTATPFAGATNTSYQWYVNGTAVGTNSNTYTYTPNNNDEIKCELTATSSCLATEELETITRFTWNDNSKNIKDSDEGLDASSGSGRYRNGGIGETRALAPITSPKTDINLRFDDNSKMNGAGIDCRISYLRREGTASLFTRGNSLIISGGSKFNVNYRVKNGSGGYTNVSSSHENIPQDNTFHDYRFKYSPIDGIGRLYVDGAQVWESPTATPGKELYWNNAGNLIIGNQMDASGADVPTLDNLEMYAVNVKPATAILTALVGTPPTTPIISAPASACVNDDAVFTINGTAGETISYSGSAAGTVTIGTGGTATITVPNITSNTTISLNSVENAYCNISLSEINAEVVANPKPTITLQNSQANICYGDQQVALPYISTTENPTLFSIDFIDTGIPDTNDAALTGNMIQFSLPGTLAAQSYDANLTVRNGQCTSNIIPIVININPLPNTGEILPD